MLNLTQHVASPEQVEAGVTEPENKRVVQKLLTFSALPTKAELETRAAVLAAIVVQSGFRSAMLGGAPFFMSALERALKTVGVSPVYAFSVRESEDQIQEDWSVRKVAVFKHRGFVEVS